MNKNIIKKVENPHIYTILKENQIKFTPKIININEDIVEYEYIEGVDLIQFQQNNIIDYNLCIDIFLKMIAILEDLKKYNIVHKDIKPKNIIINNKHEIYLIDFDASRSDNNLKNKDTILLGTEGYASPEHYGYFATSYLSDIFSLGKTMQELCNNRFNEFDYIIDKMCQFDPKNRYQDYQSLKIDIKKYLVQRKKQTKNLTINFFSLPYPIPKMQIIFTIIMLSISIPTYLKSNNPFYSLNDFIYFIFVMLVVIDLLDYIKLIFYIITNKINQRATIFKRRITLSFFLFVFTVLITSLITVLVG